jgi:hypothetical protein
MSLATFWAIFCKLNLVTLVKNKIKPVETCTSFFVHCFCVNKVLSFKYIRAGSGQAQARLSLGFGRGPPSLTF